MRKYPRERERRCLQKDVERYAKVSEDERQKVNEEMIYHFQHHFLMRPIPEVGVIWPTKEGHVR